MNTKPKTTLRILSDIVKPKFPMKRTQTNGRNLFKMVRIRLGRGSSKMSSFLRRRKEKLSNLPLELSQELCLMK